MKKTVFVVVGILVLSSLIFVALGSQKGGEIFSRESPPTLLYNFPSNISSVVHEGYANKTKTSSIITIKPDSMTQSGENNLTGWWYGHNVMDWLHEDSDELDQWGYYGNCQQNTEHNIVNHTTYYEGIKPSKDWKIYVTQDGDTLHGQSSTMQLDGTVSGDQVTFTGTWFTGDIWENPPCSYNYGDEIEEFDGTVSKQGELYFIQGTVAGHRNFYKECHIRDVDYCEDYYKTTNLTWAGTFDVKVEFNITNVHGKVTVPEGSQKPLRNVKLTLTLMDGSVFTNYTDETGNYAFNKIPRRDFDVIVELKDKDGTTEIRDDIFSSSNVFYLKTKTIHPTSEDTELNIVFHESYENLLDGMSDVQKQHLDANGVIYYHTKEASDFATKNLGLTLNHALPVEIETYSQKDGVYYCPSIIFGCSPTSSINIQEKERSSYVDSGDKPDNREWHEFSHHIMTDSLIGGDSTMPYTGSGCDHCGYLTNPDSVFGWVEGFAEFMSVMIKAHGGDDADSDPNPACYRVDGNDCYLNLEEQYNLRDSGWWNEETSIAALLWDLYDGINDVDNDHTQVTLAQIWGVLNQNTAAGTGGKRLDMKDVYDAFNSSGIVVWIQDADTNDSTANNLDEIFVAHGWYDDKNGNGEYDHGEIVGLSGDTSRPGRRNTPTINDSFINIISLDKCTNQTINVTNFTYEIAYDPPYDYYNINSTIQTLDTSNNRLSFRFHVREPQAIARIIAKKERYYDSDPLIINSSFYWDNINTGKGYLLNHTFYLVPICGGDVNRDCIVNILDLALVGKAFGSKPGDTNWNANADLDNNNIINIIDLATVGKNFGRSC